MTLTDLLRGTIRGTALGLALYVSGCTPAVPDDRDGCNDDYDCREPRVCVQGYCESSEGESEGESSNRSVKEMLLGSWQPENEKGSGIFEWPFFIYEDGQLALSRDLLACDIEDGRHYFVQDNQIAFSRNYDSCAPQEFYLFSISKDVLTINAERAYTWQRVITGCSESNPFDVIKCE